MSVVDADAVGFESSRVKDGERWNYRFKILRRFPRPADHVNGLESRAAVRYRVDLEELLTTELRKKEPNISPVTISSDGEFAIYNVNSRYTVRKLSPAAKEFLRSGNSEGLKESSLFL